MRGEAEGLAIRILNARAGHIEAMAAAYLKLTDIPPDQAVLCEQVKDGVYRWWFDRTTTADPARAQRMEELLWEVLTGVDDDFDGFSYVRDDILRFFGRDPDTEPWPSVREEADGTE